MQVTVFSCLMAFVCSSVMILFLYLLRQKRLFFNMPGVSSLLILYLLCFLRMFLPIDFPFTRVLNVYGGISQMFYPLLWKKYFVLNLTWIEALCLMTSIVAVIMLIRLILTYQKTRKFIQACHSEKDDPCRSVLKDIMRVKNLNIEVRYSKDIAIPIGTGIFRKTIILPEREYEKKELYYILLHEYTHFRNRDILTKMLTHFFCCLFWWNPVVYLLKKDMDQLLEIKCDLACTDLLDCQERAEYLSAIVSVLKRAKADEDAVKIPAAVALCQYDSKDIILERFQVVADNMGKNKEKKRSLVLCAAVSVFLFCVSYSILPQTAYNVTREKVEDSYGASQVLPGNSYLLKTKSGVYQLVTNSGIRYEIDSKMADIMVSQGFEVVEE